MRLVQLVLSLDIGGTERLVADLVRRFRTEADVSVCCLDNAGRWGEELKQEGIAVHALERKPGFDASVIRRLAALFRQQRTDLVHCHQYPAWFYGALGALLAPSTRILFTEHGRLYPDIVSHRRRLINRVLVRRTDCITSVSHAVKKALATLDGIPEERVRVLPNGIDPRCYVASPDIAAAQRMALGVGRNELVIGTVGRLDPVKDHLGLLRAFAKVRTVVPEARLLIAGDGEMRKAIEDEVQNWGLGKTVSLLGFRSDVPLLLSACDVFVLPSLNESMPVTVLEAMAVGLPVVATAVGDIPQIVDHRVSGLLCPPGDPETLADHMVTLLRDASARRRMGMTARERVRQEFTTDRMMDSYRALYRELLSH